jgi:hypothetical protein
MVFFHKRYSFPNDANIDEDEFSSWAEIAEELEKEHGALLLTPVYMYDHSGLAFRAGRGFGDIDPGSWDSGLVGIMYATQESIMEAHGSLNEEAREKARKNMEAELETYGHWVNGEVYGYRVYRPGDDDDFESTWGFFGYGWDKNGMRESWEDIIDCDIRHLGKHTKTVRATVDFDVVVERGEGPREVLAAMLAEAYPHDKVRGARLVDDED